MAAEKGVQRTKSFAGAWGVPRFYSFHSPPEVAQKKRGLSSYEEWEYYQDRTCFSYWKAL